MRIKRSKSYKKHVKFLKTKFAFQEPFQVLVDGNFIEACSRVNFDVKQMLMKLLGGIVHINIRLTLCVVSEVKNLTDQVLPSTLETLSKLRQDPCVHAGSTSAADCMERLVGSKNLKKLFVASQDKELRKKFRKIPAVPLIYFKHGIMTLEPPSECTLVKAERKERIKLKFEPSEKEKIKEMLKIVKEEQKDAKEEQRKFIYKDKERSKMKIELGKKRSAKAPNPLAVKKKKVTEGHEKNDEFTQTVLKKTRRGKKKIFDQSVDR